MSRRLFPQRIKVCPLGPRSSSAAFSLLELLVVVGIISVLAAVVVPISRTALESSRQAACVTNLRTLASGCLLYAQDHDGTLPYAVGAGAWHRLIYPYLNLSKDTTEWQENVHEGKYYICPADDSPYQEKLSYAWNKNLKSSIARQGFRLQSGSRPVIMLGEGESYSFDMSEATGLEFRHQHKGNFAFTDGHVASYAENEPLDELITLEQ